MRFLSPPSSPQFRPQSFLAPLILISASLPARAPSPPRLRSSATSPPSGPSIPRSRPCHFFIRSRRSFPSKSFPPAQHPPYLSPSRSVSPLCTVGCSSLRYVLWSSSLTESFLHGDPMPSTQNPRPPYPSLPYLDRCPNRPLLCLPPENL